MNMNLDWSGQVRSWASRLKAVWPVRIDGYRSYGSVDQVVIKGRFVAMRPPGQANAEERQLRTVGRMAGRFISPMFKGREVEIEICYANNSQRVVCDVDGFFSAVFVPLEDPVGLSWTLAQARVLDDSLGAGRWWPIPVLIVGSAVERIIVSDVDDTVLVNAGGAAARTVWATMSGSELTRSTVPDAAKVYRRLVALGHHGHTTPIFYVSSSPWNLYDFLISFLHLNGLPDGPLLLRDVGLGRRTFSDQAHKEHKLGSIKTLLETLPLVQAVLIGDSSLQDADAFVEIVDDYPGRVESVFIRDIGDPAKIERLEGLIQSRSDLKVPINVVSTMDEIFDLMNSPDQGDR